MEGVFALYVVLLAAFAGYEVISRVPTVLHTPLMSGSNFIHGIVVVGAMIALGQAEGFMQTTFGFIAVLMAAINAVGGYVVTERMLEMFRASGDEALEKSADSKNPEKNGPEKKNPENKSAEKKSQPDTADSKTAQQGPTS